jgi:hypothetical protein
MCVHVTPGEGRIRECLREHEATLSPACKQRITRGFHQAASSWRLQPAVFAHCKAERR